ncbi:hypothetical protein N9L24_03555 [Candidatus Marinamargulisbacteria bacterium]|nr:hypothetical protein [Candidatus Marinamargulisbacteria bacterium]
METRSNRLHVTRIGKILPIVACVFGFFAYMAMSQTFTYWGDELFTIFYAKKPLGEMLKQYFQQPDPGHPVGHYWVTNIWRKVMPESIAYDWWFNVLPIACHFVVVGGIAMRGFSLLSQRLAFIGVCTVSSYFFMYAKQVRYYSFASLWVMVSLYAYYRWEKTGQWQYVVVGCVSGVVLLNSSYMGYLLFVTSVAGRLLMQKRWPDWRQFSVGVGINLIGAIPVLALKSNQFSTQLVQFDYSIVKQLIIRILYLPYAAVVGEFLHPIGSLVAAVFVGALVVFVCRQATASADDTVRFSMYCVGMLFFVTVFFTTFFYPYAIQSTPRFLMPMVYLFVYSLIKVRGPSYFIMGWLMINAVVLVCNVQKTWFIQPILFIPHDEIVSQIRQQPSSTQCIISFVGSTTLISDHDASFASPIQYLFLRHFPDRVASGIDHTRDYFLVHDMPLRVDNNRVLHQIQQEFPQHTMHATGFDNIPDINKSVLSQYWGLKAQYKYYAIGLKARQGDPAPVNQ